MTQEESTQLGRRRFQSTHWSLVLAAQSRSTPAGQQAFASLCEKYWYPLYAHARRLESDQHLARDLTQGFFTRVLEGNYLADADPARGRFRTFLITSFRNYIANEWDKQNARKRGGDRLHLTLEFERGEQRYSLEPAEPETAEAMFNRRWAETTLESVLSKLAAEHENAGRGELFAALKQFLTPAATDSYRDVGERLGMSEGAVKVAVHRLRCRYRQRLCEEIAETTASEGDVEDEIRCLFEAFARRPRVES